MSHDVREYYESNTRAFLRPHRGSSSTGAIHRALWPPEVKTRIEAMHHIHHLVVAEFLKTLPQVTSIADLGCGVGASIAFLSELIQAHWTGITLSETQAALARERVPPDTTIIAGDMSDPAILDRAVHPEGNWLPLDGAYMIESFAHLQETDRFLEALSVRMQPGALLLVCDDFLDHHPKGRRDRELVEEFREGWHVPSLMSADELATRARRHQLVIQDDRCRDLSPLIRTTGVTATTVGITAAVGRRLNARSPWWDNIRGGDALRRLGARGIIRYQLLVFRRA